MLVTWFLPMLLFLGGVASYEDIREGKIRNKWILLGLCYGTIVYVYLLIANPPLLNIHELLPVLINAFLALCMGFLLWHLGLWSAGDAKLFFVLAFLLPSLQPNDYVSFMGLLTYSFVPLFMFFVFFSLISGKSSLARMGILVHTAGFVDPGFKGTITLEISNQSNLAVAIYPKMNICQIAVHSMTSPAKIPYGKRKTSLYMNQGEPTEANTKNLLS